MSTDELKKAYRITMTIGSVMIAGLFIYVAVVVFMKVHYEPFEGLSPFSNIVFLKYILYGVALLQFFLISALKRLILSGKFLFQSSREQKSSYSPDNQKLMKASIITFSLCESVAIYGLILFLLSGNVIDFLGLFVLSLIYFIVFFPRFDQWQAWIARQQDKGVAEEQASG
jgi:F0F1-type ATP synthase membrane subunit c/vacuolar-type H+-ATPase subunit K